MSKESEEHGLTKDRLCCGQLYRCVSLRGRRLFAEQWLRSLLRRGGLWFAHCMKTQKPKVPGTTQVNTVSSASRFTVFYPARLGLFRQAALHIIFLTIALSLSFVVGCGVAGGGGSTHDLLDHIIAGQPTSLRFTFSTWGAGSGDLALRYTHILMHYRKTGETDFHSLSDRIISSDEKHLTVEFIIPPQEISGAASSLDYYFDFLFDGIQNTRPHETVPITKPAA